MISIDLVNEQTEASTAVLATEHVCRSIGKRVEAGQQQQQDAHAHAHAISGGFASLHFRNSKLTNMTNRLWSFIENVRV